MKNQLTKEQQRIRFLTISNFIQDLLLAKGRLPYEPGTLMDATGAWDAILADVDYGYLTERGENSLFLMASRMGYVEAEKVLELFQCHVGTQERLEADEATYRQREAGYAAGEAPRGPARKKLQDFLAANGWPEERLLKFAELRA